MSAPKPTIEEQLKALAVLRNFWRGSSTDEEVRDAIDTLDNGGVFAALDDVTGYDTAPVISTQSAMDGKIYRSDGSVLSVPGSVEPLDPAEWGDTTREDMARHQQQEG